MSIPESGRNVGDVARKVQHFTNQIRERQRVDARFKEFMSIATDYQIPIEYRDSLGGIRTIFPTIQKPFS